MYLKSLVIKGFKSFADRVVVNLQPGICAVVGPNGSGKSNISDAVLWVLGEQKAKNLRGQEMSDVIFAGSSSRKGVSVAEVSLVLDNTDGALPVEFSEVVITRRMYAEGGSDYYINDAPARLRDVSDIIHDSGLGTGTHSIISQGNLDSILASKPLDRRALIEEAAGILKHKERAERSRRKLETMDIHLTRINDIFGEVSRAIGPLERKAKRALTYQELSAELSDYTLKLAVDDLRVLQKAWDEVVAQEAQLTDEVSACKVKVDAAEHNADELQEKFSRESSDALALTRRQSRINVSEQSLTSTGQMLRIKSRAAHEKMQEYRFAASKNEHSARFAAESLTTMKAQSAAYARDLSAKQTEVDEASVHYTAAREAVAQAENLVLAFAKERREREKNLEHLRRNRSIIQSEFDNNTHQLEYVTSKIATVTQELTAARAEADATHAQVGEAGAVLEHAKESLNACLARVEKLTQTQNELVAKLEEEREALHAVDAEIKGIKEVERAFLAAGSGTQRWLVGEKSGFAHEVSSIVEGLKVEKRFEHVVEALLGEEINALTAEDGAVICAIDEALARESLDGNVVLLNKHSADAFCAPCENAASPLPAQGDPTPAYRDMSAMHAFAQTCGASVLYDELTCPEAQRSALFVLLGDVLVVDSLAHALDLAERNGAYRYATLEGDIVFPGGKVCLSGTKALSDDGVIARRRRLEECVTAQKQLSREVAELQTKLDLAKSATDSAQKESLGLSSAVAEKAGFLKAAEKSSDMAEEKATHVQHDLDSLQELSVQLQQKTTASQPAIDEYTNKIADELALLDALNARDTEIQETLTPSREAEKACADVLSAAKIALGALKEKSAYHNRIVQDKQNELSNAEYHLKQNTRNGAVQAVTASRLSALAEVFDILEEAAAALRRATEREIAAVHFNSGDSNAAVSAARETARALRREYDALNERINEAKIEKTRLESRVAGAVETIEKECHVSLDTALKQPVLDNRAEAEEESARIRKRLAGLGTINPDAAEEYRAMKKRYDFLEGQINDLTEARRSLSKINKIIDNRMRDDFLQTFSQVNDNFREIFSSLFEGGTAELQLEDPQNPDTTGVEVVAQPRGKKITKMSLMSGGEKSLTALALLFAVYRTRSTPFYILDEVEAALDDPNLHKLVNYLNALRDKTQFIVITHQRVTMEAADVLFGVSMQEGVTKVISQKLDKALQYAED